MTGRRSRLVAAPYDPAVERFNDGKADAMGRLWVGTIYEPSDRAAGLHPVPRVPRRPFQ